MCNKNMKFVNLPLCVVALLITVIEGLPPWHQSAVQWEAPRKECLHPYPDWGCVNPLCYHVGTQGPCNDGQIFKKIPENFDMRQLRGGALGKTCGFHYAEHTNYNLDVNLNLDLNNTYPPLTNPGQSYGYCVWNDTKHPCNGLPANQRYSNETERCHTLGLQEYCPANQAFYTQRYISEGMIYGSCDCYPLFEMWYDPNDGNCYPPHSQGSCPPGQWLTIKWEYGPVVCEPAPCPADGKHVYWTEGHQQCYHRGERGPCAESPYEEVLGLPFGILQCASLRTVGPTITSRTPTRFCGETWQTASKMSQVSQDCDWRPPAYEPSSQNTNRCGQATYSRTLKRCVLSD